MSPPYNYYIGPWVLNNHGYGDIWEGPNNSIAVVDLRPEPDKKIKTLGSKPWGFFAVPSNVFLPGEYGFLGQGDCRYININNSTLDTWQSFTGYRPAGTTLIGVVWDYFTNGSDPTGATAPLPLIPDANGILRFVLPGHSIVKSEKFVYGVHPHTPKVRDFLKEEYRRLHNQRGRNRASPVLPNKVLDFWCEKFRLNGPDDWKNLVPPDLIPGNQGRVPHGTSYTENFNGSDGDSIANLLSWTELRGDFDKANNRALLNSANTDSDARADHDVSSNDNYSQAKVSTVSNSGTYRRVGVTFRKDNTITETFYCAIVDFDANTVRLLYFSAGTPSAIASGSYTLSDGGTQFTVKGEANGSTIKHYMNGTEQLSVTNTSIGGNTRGGLFGYTSSAGVGEWDDFETADIAAGTPNDIYGRTYGCGTPLSSYQDTKRVYAISPGTSLPLLASTLQKKLTPTSLGQAIDRLSAQIQLKSIQIQANGQASDVGNVLVSRSPAGISPGNTTPFSTLTPGKTLSALDFCVSHLHSTLNIDKNVALWALSTALTRGNSELEKAIYAVATASATTRMTTLLDVTVILAKVIATLAREQVPVASLSRSTKPLVTIE